MLRNRRPTRTLPLVADVLVPVALDNAYSYRVPAGLAVAAGDFVTVPLGMRETTGIVWSVQGSRSGGNLKEIAARRELPPLNAKLLRFVDWIAHYTLAPRGMVLRMVMRVPDADQGETPRVGVRVAAAPRKGEPLRMTPARSPCAESRGRRALLPQIGARRSRRLLDRRHRRPGRRRRARDVGMAPEPVALPRISPLPSPLLDPSRPRRRGTSCRRSRAAVFPTTLLEGVTGSGKTEVYFEAVAAALATGGQVLILMPEIALTGQFLDRFARRFGVRPAEWHSGVAAAQRARIWAGVAVERGARRCRRALGFVPAVCSDLGLIVVDEEHEPAYKQEDGVIYHARDMAVVRGRIEGAAVVLASATPSIETRVNAAQERYGHVELTSRHAGRALPQSCSDRSSPRSAAARALDLAGSA